MTHTQQLTRGGVPVRARLAQLLSEAASPNPRWLVKFDGMSLKDEEIYQHSFGKTLVSVAAASASASSSSSPSSKRGGSDSNEDDHGSVDANGSMTSAPPSPEPDKEQDVIKKTAISSSSHHNSSNDEDDEDEEGSTSFPSGTDELTREQARVSAREARSRRRQAKMVQEITKASKTRPGGFRSGISKNGKRAREEGEECVKIPFLTGTLYLYRGPKKRRAEFVRRI